MSYVKPYIDATGLHLPDYASVRDYLSGEFLRIFGQDLYLGEDSQDYQMISLFADALDDVNALVIEAYNSRNPDFARGTSLDLMLPLNGLSRLQATHSRVTLTLYGVQGAYIPAGSVAVDRDGHRWIIQDEVMIGSSGSGSVEARAEAAGNRTAGVGFIDGIGTPTSGWVSVSNLTEAMPGRDTETDAQVRARRLASVETSAVSLIESLYGALVEVPDVTRVTIYENKTGTFDLNGIPAHSICAVVEGGSQGVIAETILRKKAPGCGLFGTTVVEAQDLFGNTVTVPFMRPVNSPMEVHIELKKLRGYSTESEALIAGAVAEYIRGFGIGQVLETGLLWGVVLGQTGSGNAATFAPVSIGVCLAEGTPSSASLSPAYYEILTCDSTDVSITYTA